MYLGQDTYRKNICAIKINQLIWLPRKSVWNMELFETENILIENSWQWLLPSLIFTAMLFHCKRGQKHVVHISMLHLSINTTKI